MDYKLGKYIKDARDEKELSLRKLATLTGISASYLSLLEKGIDPRSGNPPSVTLAVLRKLAAGLDLPLATLINAAQTGNGGAVLPIEVTGPKTAAPRLMKGEDIVMIPVIGELTAGQKSLKDMEVVDQCPVNVAALNIPKDEISNYYWMKMADDSMAPNICPSDDLLIRQGPVKDGQVGAIICAGEKGCIREITYAPESDMVVLTAFNPTVKPVIKRMSDCKVLGAVEWRFGPPLCK